MQAVTTEEEEEKMILSSTVDIADTLRSDENLGSLYGYQTVSAIVEQVKHKTQVKKDVKKLRL